MEKISRYNYEEYFLLYVDNELTDEQKKAVEEFSFANADLAEEFEMLKETRLFAADKIQFDKSVLYKEVNNITSVNAEKFFLLHIDNELDETQQAELKVFLLKNPSMEKQLNLLRQAVLPKEKIEFTNKEILYKKEKDKRVIPFNWLRVAVAAALIGAAIFILKINSGTKEQNSIAEHHNANKKLVPTISPDNNSANKNIQPNDSFASAGLIPKPAKSVNENVIEKNKKIELAEKNNSSQIQNPGVDASQDKLQKQDQNNSGNQQEVTTENNSVNNADQQKIIEQRILDAQKRLDNADKVFAANTQSENDMLHPAVYHELNNEDDDKGVYIGSVELNKNKVRSLFKKASRIFGGKAKDQSDGGDLKVAGLDINTKTL